MTETPRNYQIQEKPRTVTEVHQPVVICIDTSGSMADEAKDGTGRTKYEVVEEQINALANLQELDDRTKSCVDICVLAFDNEVRTIVNWRSLSDFHGGVTFDVQGCTALGDAVIEAIKKSRERRNQYDLAGIKCKRPQIFVFTDGVSTQDMKPAYQFSEDYLNKMDSTTGKIIAKAKMYVTLIPPAVKPDDLIGFGKAVSILKVNECRNGLLEAFQFMQDSIVSASSVTGGEATTRVPDHVQVYTGNGNDEFERNSDGRAITTQTDLWG